MRKAKEPCAAFISSSFLSNAFFGKFNFTWGSSGTWEAYTYVGIRFLSWVSFWGFWGGGPEVYDRQPAESHAHSPRAKGRSWNAEDKAECKSIQCSNLRCGRSPLMHRKVLSVNEAGIFSLQNRAAFWISGFPSALWAWKRTIKQLFPPHPPLAFAKCLQNRLGLQMATVCVGNSEAFPLPWEETVPFLPFFGMSRGTSHRNGSLSSMSCLIFPYLILVFPR